MDLVVVDHYQLTRDFERDCRTGSARIAIIDDLANRPHDADLLVDATPGRSDQDYKNLVPENCRLLLGPLFALLRREFAVMGDFCSMQRSTRAVKRILVCMGNSDIHDVTSLAMDVLEKRSLEVDVVLGAKSPNCKKVEARIEKMGSRFRFHVDTTEMARLMCEADLAIGSCGVSALERCAVGLPAVGIVTAENQRLSAGRLADRGAIVLAGWWSDLSVRALGDVLDRTLERPDGIAALSRAAAQICDGKGASRVALEACGYAA
jgi:UDP-2,4-diacetamido-2,4,6-trideoxy-beta-L-altropyranose hydrolase